MKNKVKHFYNAIKELPKEIKITICVVLVIASFSSASTYYFLQRQIPKFAVVDIAYLNNDFVMTLSRYLLDHKASDEEVANMVKLYLSSLEEMLGDIRKSGNYVLIQRQMIVSDNVVDLTKDLEKALFESVMSNNKN